MDRTRHQADSLMKYEAYFDLLHQKLEEYCLDAGDVYNIDEKGFLIGIVGTGKRIFSKRQWDKKEVRASLQDGSRLIYASARGAIRSNWVEGIAVGEHEVFITSTPSGWSNNDVGLAWLEQVFDRCTKNKPGRWRLLILDGYGSHVTPEFIEYCNRHRILLMVFPPHSTHTLQPLDVVMFKPLSISYSNELTNHLHNAQVLVSVKKEDFFPLSWRAWSSSFTKNNILKAFSATGIWPADPNVILKKFSLTPDKSHREQSRLSPSDWNHLRQLVQNELLRHEMEGLRAALSHKQKHKGKGKALDLQQRKEYHGGAVFWSPRKFREARAREAVREREEMEEKLQKTRAKKGREETQLQRQVEREEKRTERLRLNEMRKLERAEKAAERARKKEARNTEKAQHQAQKRKRTASRVFTSKNKRQKLSVVDGAHDGAASTSSSIPPKITTRGRSVKPPQKFR
ncbi:DDE-1 multi-domain protein [Pyrenophora tritici-repentis]|nr:DDE-1 multi-domain protein [Pyrenophora tritici-repentis]